MARYGSPLFLASLQDGGLPLLTARRVSSKLDMSTCAGSAAVNGLPRTAPYGQPGKDLVKQLVRVWHQRRESRISLTCSV